MLNRHWTPNARVLMRSSNHPTIHPPQSIHPSLGASIGSLLRGSLLPRIMLVALACQLSPPPLTSSAQDATNANSNSWRNADTPSTPSEKHTAAFTQGLDVLPNTAGQIWRNYDIRPFTSKFAAETKPERQIVDWILRETGTDLWFGEPLGILSATRDTLRVYHTPEIQQVVHDMINRFTDPSLNKLGLTFRLVTVGSPNWRSRAIPILQPVNIETPGIQAWLVSKENAAILLGELRKRTDFVEHQTPNMMITNGESRVLTRSQPISYARSIRRDPNGWLLPAADMGRFEEGYTLQISLLHAQDGAASEVVIKADVKQLEKLQPVNIDIPTPVGATQRIQLQVPQISSWSLHERFRWPADQVLLLSCGVVASPGPEPNRMLGLPKILDPSSPRADALLFIENKPTADKALYTGGLNQPFNQGIR